MAKCVCLRTPDVPIREHLPVCRCWRIGFCLDFFERSVVALELLENVQHQRSGTDSHKK